MTVAQTEVLRRWKQACRQQSGDSSQLFEFAADNGERYRWHDPQSRAEPDAIGVIERRYEAGAWKRSGSYRIAADGTIERAPRGLLEAANATGKHG